MIQTLIVAYTILLIAVVVYRWWDRRNHLTFQQQTHYEDLITLFFEDPSKEDFDEVWAARKALINTVGRSIKFWLWGVSQSYPEYFSDDQKAEVASFSRDIERGIRRITTRPTPELLDCIWALYFSNGDASYPELVKNIAEHSTDGILSRLAKQSYESIMRVKLWDDNNVAVIGTADDFAITPTDDIASDDGIDDTTEATAMIGEIMAQ